MPRRCRLLVWVFGSYVGLQSILRFEALFPTVRACLGLFFRHSDNSINCLSVAIASALLGKIRLMAQKLRFL